MIDKKKIKAAANKELEAVHIDYQDKDGYILYPTSQRDLDSMVMDTFTNDAEWAQEEFVKSLWHDASEKPKLNTYCIGYYKDFSGCVVFNNPSDGADWDTYVQHSSLSKWCYVDDILPKDL